MNGTRESSVGYGIQLWLTAMGLDLFCLHSARVGGAVALEYGCFGQRLICVVGGWAARSKQPEKYARKGMEKRKRAAKLLSLDKSCVTNESRLNTTRRR